MNNLPDYATAVIGNDLRISPWQVPDYDPETISTAEETSRLRSDLLKFIEKNKKYWTPQTLAQFLGMTIDDLDLLLDKDDLRDFNKQKAHTILIVKPLADAEIDSVKYEGNLI